MFFFFSRCINASQPKAYYAALNSWDSVFNGTAG